MSGTLDATPRPLAPADAEPVRALVLGALGVTTYVDRALELLAAAEHGDPESRALVMERDGTATALVLYGPVSGARDAWRIGMLLLAPHAEPTKTGRALVDAVVADVRRAGGRLLVAELPADAALGRSLSLLRANDFDQEARIPDFFREGVALLFLRRAI